MDYPFVILPEEQTPEDIQHCERCELSKQRNRVIWGEGNPQAPLMMILDNQFFVEDLKALKKKWKERSTSA